MALPASVVRLSARRLCLPQRPDHRRLQPAAWLRVNCSIDGFTAHAGDRIIRLHDPQSRRNLLGRPVHLRELAMGKAIKIASFDKLALAATRAAGSIDKACRVRTIGAVFLPTPRQFAADRARRSMQKLSNRPLVTAPIMLGEYHATVLTDKVLVFAT